MSVKQIVKVFTLAAVVFSFFNFSVLTDGTRKDALSAYNAGSKLANENPKAAIDSLLLALSIAEKLDSNGLDIVTKTTKKLPGLYYSVGLKSYKSKSYSAAIKELLEAKTVAEKYTDEKTVKKVNRTLYAAYYKEGKVAFKAKDFNSALASFDKSLAVKNDYLTALFYKGRTHKELKQYDQMLAAFDKVIELGGADEKNAKIVGASKSAAASGLKAQGKNAVTAGDNSTAIASFEKAITYLPANPEKTAGYYYEIGKAYQKSGQKGKACEAYRKASFGKYKENAEYKIKNDLKCN
jgi:tetratricopeptide (TPR) repeat protein